MKKFVIPLCSVVAGAAVAVGLIALRSGNVAHADLPDYEIPEEIPSGRYYLNGDPTNDSLYLVVDGKTIHFESDHDLREGFKELTRSFDEMEGVDEAGIDHQTDMTMLDWGESSYTYTVKRWLNLDPKEFVSVYFRIAENEDGTSWTGRALHYSDNTKTISGWAGEYILFEESTDTTTA